MISAVIVGRHAGRRGGYRRLATRCGGSPPFVDVVLVTCGRITELGVVPRLPAVRPRRVPHTPLAGSHRHRAPSDRLAHLRQDPLWLEPQPVKGRLREIPVLPLGHRPLLCARGPLTSDGKWKITTGSARRTRHRSPSTVQSTPKKFNGTVVVEWLNVSGGTDDAPEWTLSHNQLIRDGFAWVGVSAQRSVSTRRRPPILRSTRRSRTPATASLTTSSRRLARRFAPTPRGYWLVCGPAR